MKRQIPGGAGIDGSILLMTLIIMGILCLAIGSYLYLLRTTNNWVERSQAWNTALALAEAGIEEGMAQINSGFGTNNMGSANGNNWTGPAGGIYGPKAVTMPGGGTYSATIDLSGALSSMPVITVTGETNPAASSTPVSRTVRVYTVATAAFSGAMVAMNDVSFKGNYIAIDSFDSSIGMYDVNTNRHANGDVASMFGVVNVQNADVKGHLWTGPTGTYSVGANGSVGDLNWAGPGLEPGWYFNDFNMDVSDVTPPYDPGAYGAPYSFQTNNNTFYVLGSSKYAMSSLTLNAGDQVVVIGNATLYVTGNVTMNSSGNNASQINIARGASLKIYVAGTSAVFQQVNTSGNASTFQYFGLPSNTSLTWQGNSAYVGSVYAPEALFSLGGGGNNNYDYQGACVVNSVVMNGHFNFHYDENLKRIGPVSGFTVSRWQEL